MFHFLNRKYSISGNKLGCFHDKIPRSSDQSDNQADRDIKPTHQNHLTRPTESNFIRSNSKNSISPSINKIDNQSEMLNPNNLNLPSTNAKLPSPSTENERASELGRKKMTLGKGFSLMDWIRYSKSTPNIAGNNGIMRQITYEELASHNKQDDCWMSIFGKLFYPQLFNLVYLFIFLIIDFR